MKYTLFVNILPQDNLLDPQGKAVISALHDLGFISVLDTRIGKRIRLEIESNSPEEALKSANEAAKLLLANPISDQFNVEIAM